MNRRGQRRRDDYDERGQRRRDDYDERRERRGYDPTARRQGTDPPMDGGGTLKVDLHSASDIKAADLGGTSDAFVCLEVLPGPRPEQYSSASRSERYRSSPKDARRSGVVKRTTSPSWEESFELAIPDKRTGAGAYPDDVLRLSLWDYDSGKMREMFSTTNDPLGGVDVRLSELQRGTPGVTQKFDREIELDGKPAGKVRFSVSWHPSSANVEALARRLDRQEKTLRRMEQLLKQVQPPKHPHQRVAQKAKELAEAGAGTIVTSTLTSAILDKEQLMEAVHFIKDEWLSYVEEWASENLVLATLIVGALVGLVALYVLIFQVYPIEEDEEYDEWIDRLKYKLGVVDARDRYRELGAKDHYDEAGRGGGAVFDKGSGLFDKGNGLFDRDGWGRPVSRGGSPRDAEELVEGELILKQGGSPRGYTPRGRSPGGRGELGPRLGRTQSLPDGRLAEMLRDGLSGLDGASETLPAAPRLSHRQLAELVVDARNAEAPLPLGWEEFRDDDGKPYYYHAQTGRTEWDRPGSGGYDSTFDT